MNIWLKKKSWCRFVLRCPFRIHHSHLHDTINWQQPKPRRHFHWVFIFKCIYRIYINCRTYLKSLLIPFRSLYALRTVCNIPSIPYPTYPKKLAVKHLDSKLHLTRTISHSLSDKSPSFTVASHRFSTMSKQTAHVFQLLTHQLLVSCTAISEIWDWDGWGWASCLYFVLT